MPVSYRYESVCLADWKKIMMALLTPSQQKEIISELDSLAQLLGVDVVESIKFPTIMVRVSLGGSFSAITKQGSDFLATDALPGVPMTLIGGGMFKYKVEV
jgi:hypothetical protein